jgi:hypothetical protein
MSRAIIRDLPAGYWSPYPLRLVREELASLGSRPRIEWVLEAFRPIVLVDDKGPWSYSAIARFATRKDALAHLTLLVTGGREVPR